jgi:hypothetical protein
MKQKVKRAAAIKGDEQRVIILMDHISSKISDPFFFISLRISPLINI